MKMAKKLLALVLTGVMAMSVLTGCGSTASRQAAGKLEGMLLAGVEYFQAVSPRELPFHDIDRIFVFVVNVIAVKPGKCTLFE